MSRPSTLALAVTPSSNATTAVLTPATTCAFVRIRPCLSITKPEPCAVSLCDCDGPNGEKSPDVLDLTVEVIVTTPGASCL